MQSVAGRAATKKFLNRKDDGPLAPVFEPIKPELLSVETASTAVGDFHLADRVLNNGYRARRRAEAEVAHYIDTKIVDFVPTSYAEVKQQERFETLIHSMRRCRREGTWGTLDDRLVVVWKHKCGCLHLCPDEAREEQDRLQARYVPAIEKLLKRGYRVYKLTISPENIPTGYLAWGQRQLYREWFRFRRARAFQNIIGSLCTLEAPLSRHGDWNVHLNVLLVCEGELNYTAVRRWWKCQVEQTDWIAMKQKTLAKLRARGLDPKSLTTEEVLHHALEEIVKYPVQTVAAKSGSGAATGDAGNWDPDSGLYRDAEGRISTPPLTAWPRERFVEWFEAQRRFRRTRSYGELHGIEQDTDQKIDLEQFKQRFQRRGFVRWNGGRYLISIAGALPTYPPHGYQVKRPSEKTGPPGPEHDALVAQVMASARYHWENNLSYTSNF